MGRRRARAGGRRRARRDRSRSRRGVERAARLLRRRRHRPAEGRGRSGSSTRRQRDGVATVGAHVDRADDLAELARAADFVVAAADEPSGRAVGRMVAQALVPARVPHVFAAYLGAAVRVGPLWAPTKRRMACAECALASVPPDRIPRTVTAFGLPQAQLTATMAVQASLQELVGGASPLRGRVVVLDPGTGESWRSRVRRDPACEVCGQAVAQHRRTAKGGEVPR